MNFCIKMIILSTSRDCSIVPNSKITAMCPDSKFVLRHCHQQPVPWRTNRGRPIMKPCTICRVRFYLFVARLLLTDTCPRESLGIQRCKGPSAWRGLGRVRLYYQVVLYTTRCCKCVSFVHKLARTSHTPWDRSRLKSLGRTAERDFFIRRITVQPRNKATAVLYYAGIAHYTLPAHTIKIVMRHDSSRERFYF